jgi:addiction module HigA family antidote
MSRQPTHPGEVLREEFLKPLRLTAADLSRGISVPIDRVTEILHGERAVSVDTAIRLGRFFRTNPRFWLNLQAIYDLARAEAENPHSDIEPWRTHFHNAYD